MSERAYVIAQNKDVRVVARLAENGDYVQDGRSITVQHRVTRLARKDPPEWRWSWLDQRNMTQAEIGHCIDDLACLLFFHGDDWPDPEAVPHLSMEEISTNE